MAEKTILVMAGGTGGHVYPALAVAQYLRDRGSRLLWIGTRTGIEARVVPENGFPLLLVHIRGLRGKTLLRRVTAPLMLVLALFQTLIIMIRYKPDAVIGLGGFVSGPGGIAAWLLRIPLYIHEQNAIAGLTNRLLAPLARTVMLGFPGAFEGKRVVTTGNPVRVEIRELESPQTRISSRQHNPLRLLVLGGSLGAKALNELLPEVLSSLPEHIQIEVWHQTGTAHIGATRDLYATHHLHQVRVVAYITDMAEAYSWADMVLCRSGASTIGEICAAGIASILVPYPHAVDDHQTANARYLSDAGAAILIPQAELSVNGVRELLSGFFRERRKLLDMAMIARSKAFPDATSSIGNICMGVSHA